MVRVVEISPQETYKSERVRNLMSIVEETLGADEVNMNARGEYITVGFSGFTTAQMDIYPNRNQIDIYSPDLESLGIKVARAFESAGEREFTVRKNYDPEFYRNN